jgi:branched-chain amino acid transport system permease protein
LSSVIVSGVIVGFLYALLGAGLVIIYRESHVLNFAHGAVGTAAAYFAYALDRAGWPYGIAIVIAVVAAAVLSSAIEFSVVRRLGAVSEFTVSVATLGLGLLIIGVVQWHWDVTPRALRPPLKTSWTLDIFGISIGSTQVIAVIVTLVIFALLFVVIERTRFGLALRAVSEGPVTAGMLGINVPMLRAASWALAGALAGIAAILITPLYDLDPQFLTTFMITSFAAIVLGGLESIGGVLAGGLLFGLGSSLLGYYLTARLTQTFAFAAILIVLLVFPHGLFGRRLQRVVEPVIRGSLRGGLTLSAEKLGPSARRLLTSSRGIALFAGIAVLAIAPWIFSGLTVFRLTLVIATFIAVLGQNAISGYGGQASIGQSGFMVVGGYVSAMLAYYYDLPFALVLLLAALASAAVGVVLAVSAARLSGVYLALLTLTFALALPELAAFPDETGGADGLFIGTQEVFGIKLQGGRNVYLFVLVIALLVAGAFYLAARGAPGRAWRAVRDSEVGAASVGLPVERVKVSVVALGGALAGLSAALTVVLVAYISPESFVLWTAIYLLAAVVIGGSSSILGSALGAAFVTLIPIYTASLPELPQIVFGAAIVLTLLFAPNGLANVIRLPRRDPLSRPGILPGTGAAKARDAARASGADTAG